jgi:hypothetical protein
MAALIPVATIAAMGGNKLNSTSSAEPQPALSRHLKLNSCCASATVPWGILSSCLPECRISAQ